jgi:hypothetical protein
MGLRAFRSCTSWDNSFNLAHHHPKIYSTAAELLDVIRSEVTSTNGIYSPPPRLSKSSLKKVCYVNIVYGNLKSENFQDYAQKPQRNCMFRNLASVVEQKTGRLDCLYLCWQCRYNGVVIAEYDVPLFKPGQILQWK